MITRPARAVTRPPGTTWATHWETTLSAEEHVELAELLARAFPHTAAFGQGQSWAGSRPELRIAGRIDGQLVAHAATIRRFLRAPDDDHDDHDVLVGDVGLVAVDPRHQGKHLGRDLMDEVASTLARLELPFGFLTCGVDVEAFYRRHGWRKTYQPLHAIDINHQVEIERRHGMVLPVHQALETWPRGRLARDGQEL